MELRVMSPSSSHRHRICVGRLTHATLDEHLSQGIAHHLFAQVRAATALDEVELCVHGVGTVDAHVDLGVGGEG